jgi:hypothetical protein
LASVEQAYDDESAAQGNAKSSRIETRSSNGDHGIPYSYIEVPSLDHGMDLKGAGTDSDGYRTDFREIRGLPVILGMTSMNLITKMVSSWVLTAIFFLIPNWSQTTKLRVVILILIL